MLFRFAALLALLLLPLSAAAQNFGLINPQTVIGNPSATAKAPAAPMPMDLLRPALDVRFFGAKCDGLHDDTTALQAWLDAATDSNMLGIPVGICVFTLPLLLPHPPDRMAMAGASPFGSVLLYAGSTPTTDLIRLGTRGGALWNSGHFFNFNVASVTTMTDGAGLRIASCLDCQFHNVNADGMNGNGKLWHGLWLDEVAAAVTFGGEFYTQGDACRVNGRPGWPAPLKAGANFISSWCRGTGPSSVAVHLGGAFGGLFLDPLSQADLAHTNYLDDTLLSSSPESNRERLIFGLLDSAQDENGHVNDPGAGAISGGGYFLFWGSNGGSGGNNLNIQAAKNAMIDIRGLMFVAGQTAYGDNLVLNDATATYHIDPARIALAGISGHGGYGVNCTAPIPKVQLWASVTIAFQSNADGDWHNCDPNASAQKDFTIPGILHGDLMLGIRADQPITADIGSATGPGSILKGGGAWGAMQQIVNRAALGGAGAGMSWGIEQSTGCGAWLDTGFTGPIHYLCQDGGVRLAGSGARIAYPNITPPSTPAPGVLVSYADGTDNLHKDKDSAGNVAVLGHLVGTTGSIGGSALAAGQCASGTATVNGATSTMIAVASPPGNVQPDANHGVSIWAYVSAPNVVTVTVCAIIAGTTPNAAPYKVAVLKAG